MPPILSPCDPRVSSLLDPQDDIITGGLLAIALIIFADADCLSGFSLTGRQPAVQRRVPGLAAQIGRYLDAERGVRPAPRSSAHSSATGTATGGARACSVARIRCSFARQHLIRAHEFYERHGGRGVDPGPLHPDRAHVRAGRGRHGGDGLPTLRRVHRYWRARSGASACRPPATCSGTRFPTVGQVPGMGDRDHHHAVGCARRDPSVARAREGKSRRIRALLMRALTRPICQRDTVRA